MKTGRERSMKKYKYNVPLIISDYQSGMTLPEVGEKHFCSYEVVRKILKENGIERNHVRGKGRHNK
jgi:hypothetical protein